MSDSAHDIGWATKPKDDPSVLALREQLIANNGIKGLDVVSPFGHRTGRHAVSPRWVCGGRGCSKQRADRVFGRWMRSSDCRDYCLR